MIKGFRSISSSRMILWWSAARGARRTLVTTDQRDVLEKRDIGEIGVAEREREIGEPKDESVLRS